MSVILNISKTIKKHVAIIFGWSKCICRVVLWTPWRQHNYVDFWRQTASLTVVCIKLQPPASSSRASKWRARASPHLDANVDTVHCDCDLCLQNDYLIYVYDSLWFDINDFDSDKSLFLHKLATQLYVPDADPRALQIGDVAGDFYRMLS